MGYLPTRGIMGALGATYNLGPSTGTYKGDLLRGRIKGTYEAPEGPLFLTCERDLRGP